MRPGWNFKEIKSAQIYFTGGNRKHRSGEGEETEEVICPGRVETRPLAAAPWLRNWSH